MLGAVLGAAVPLLLAGCSGSTTWPLPQFNTDDEVMFHRYNGTAELADISSAIVIVNPTNESFQRSIPALPGANQTPAPADYVRVTVVQVLAGTVDIGQGNKIDIVSPGIDVTSGQLTLLKGAPCLLFITPAMLDKNNPLGGYVVSGGPNGMFCQTSANQANDYYSVFSAQNDTLPTVITVGKTSLPSITHTEAELIAMGPQ